jgi:predicted DNA-binding transcriptional regulator AlpA
MHAATANDIIGKKELAAELGWSRPTLDKRIKTDPRFPVESIGDQSGGWKFSIRKVRRYLNGEIAPEPKPKGIDLPQLRDTVKKPVPKAAEETALQVVEALKNAPTEGKPARKSAYHSGEASARQRKDEADAALKEDKLRELRGELVQKGELRQALANVMARLGHDLDALPEKIVKALDLREDIAPGIRAMIDQVRTEMVRGAEPLLAETETQSP